MTPDSFKFDDRIMLDWARYKFELPIPIEIHEEIMWVYFFSVHFEHLKIFLCFSGVLI